MKTFEMFNKPVKEANRPNQYHVPGIERHPGLEKHAVDLDTEKRIQQTWNHYLDKIRNSDFGDADQTERSDILIKLSKLRRLAAAKGIQLEESVLVEDETFTHIADMLYSTRPDLFTQHGDEYVMSVIDDVVKYGRYGDAKSVMNAIINKLDNNQSDNEVLDEQVPASDEEYMLAKKALAKIEPGMALASIGVDPKTGNIHFQCEHGHDFVYDRSTGEVTKTGQEFPLDEVAPPGMEDWIKDRKPEFKKRYGDKWEEVLYATAWKQHNAK